jgi:hypothetical protein
MKDPAQQPEFTDGVFSFELGMNSGQSPLILPRNQLANANNVTVRGDFAIHRPAFRKLQLSYAVAGVQAQFENGMYQGGCFYNGDDGSSSLMAAVSGRLFQLLINENVASVSDESIPGDLNPATQGQAWLWQSENYIVWNDGLSNPVFWDGATSRRSFGPSAVLATISTNFTTPNQSPNAGSSVNVALSSAYTGQYNIPVLVNGARYQLIQSNAVYQATLKNISGTGGDALAIGAQVKQDTSIFGVISGDFSNGPTVWPAGTDLYFTFTLPNNLAVGAKFIVNGLTWTVSSLSAPTQVAARTTVATSNISVTDGQIIKKSPNAGTVSTVATLSASAVAPARGSTVTVTLTAPYTGAAAATVYIGTAQYQITAVAPTPAGTTVTLVNINDTVNALRTAPLTINSIPELPPGRMGAYGMGRNWVCLTDGISFIAGDIVGGSSGTAALNYRDSVLKISENGFLNGGGVFRVPGSIGDIRAMRFATTLDASLGQGPLQVYTSTTVFSCNAPVDRTTWQNLTNPILTESLKANGAMGQDSTIAANGDTFFRSIDGLRSLILARRDFATWGNVPQSREVQPVLDLDDPTLLSFGSAIIFDNRLLFTADPVASPSGTYHDTTIALNFDALSSLRQKSQPVYDGVWTGLNVLQYITGLVNGQLRAFAFCLNRETNAIELWEVLKTDSSSTDDGTPIVWEIETATLFKEVKNKGVFDYCRLTDGELGVDQISGPVNFEVFYRPDQSEVWTLWKTWSVDGVRKFYPRMGFGQPSPEAFDPDSKDPYRDGYTFQFKVRVTGSCRILKMKIKTVALPTPQWAKPICS